MNFHFSNQPISHTNGNQRSKLKINSFNNKFADDRTADPFEDCARGLSLCLVCVCATVMGLNPLDSPLRTSRVTIVDIKRTSYQWPSFDKRECTLHSKAQTWKVLDSDQSLISN